jgi:hypothetical protein
MSSGGGGAGGGGGGGGSGGGGGRGGGSGGGSVEGGATAAVSKGRVCFCLAKARPATTSPAATDAADGRRQELRRMRPSQLQRAALEAGASPADVEAAVDGEAPRDSLVALLLEHEDRSLVLLQQELAPLKASQLQRRALAAGVSDASVDEALDGEDAKAALTALIIAQRDEAPAPQSGVPDAKDRPHFVGGAVGSTSSAAVSAPAPAVSAPSSAAVQSTAHVMLSYQWDHQTQVTRVYDMLTKLGVKCWMDIRGGMQSGDIYDDMASGISGACAVVCFMSQSYQMSENCMLVRCCSLQLV